MKVWWGTFDLPKSGILQKIIGPLWLAVRKNNDEFLIYHNRDGDWEDTLVEEKMEREGNTPDEASLKERFVLKGADPTISLKPLLADRSIVTRPSTPFYVPSGKSATIYVSTPLWVKIGIGPDAVELVEVPILRPSDTWFGPNTRQGELCYASRTSARLLVKQLPKRAHRAITPVKIYNESDSHLLLERINLPVPYLELYETADKILWTEGVKMVRKEKNELDVLEIEEGAPSEVAKASFVAGPREKVQEKNLIRTISGFFA